MPGRGRFAPSPTGPLHLGSLVSALASFLDARAHGQSWIIRLEDLDPPREQAGARDLILRQLQAHGLQSDEPLWFQSQRGDAYQAALERLKAHGLVYACRCSRRQLEQDLNQGLTSRNADGEILYSGRCRTPHASPTVDEARGPVAWRFRSPAGQDDFVVKRADGFWAYHLAVVVDDAAQGISRIVRGDDLALALPRHRALQQALGLSEPEVLHVPVLRNAQGEKLSKQTQAPALSVDQPRQNLQQAWAHLQQVMPEQWLTAARPVFQDFLSRF